jgi:benzoyl-CoA reductase/2-hydroxyglutaryl-CoA dehydratase subunit BcrC/BadD/HgdB
MPRDEYNILLKEALEEISRREGISGYRARIMVGGSVCDDDAFIKLIESRGCIVVTDSLCFGGRHFTGLIDEDGDPMEALARRYFYHNPCPRMAGEYENRLDYIKRLYREAKADGIILQKLGFCDNHGVENSILAKDLEAEGIPVLTVDRQHILGDIGRYTTRFDAFLERLEGRA